MLYCTPSIFKGYRLNADTLFYFTFVAYGDSLDWMNKGSDNVVNRVLSKAKPGSIVLFHNAAKDTPAALPRIIDGLKAEGYSFLPVSELIYYDNFTIDHTGKQIPTGNN